MAEEPEKKIEPRYVPCCGENHSTGCVRRRQKPQCKGCIRKEPCHMAQNSRGGRKPWDPKKFEA